jgi:hypothetical protein
MKMSIIIIVVQVVLGLLFLLIGSMTVAGMKMFVENFRRFGYPQWFRIVTGSLEALGGIGLLIGIWVPWLGSVAGRIGERWTDAGHAGRNLDPAANKRALKEDCPGNRAGGAGKPGRRQLLVYVPAPGCQAISKRSLSVWVRGPRHLRPVTHAFASRW